MLSLLYFDVEDHFSPPEHPVHRLPMHLGRILRRHGLTGCFHVIGEKARFMERHGQRDVIEELARHDTSLHYDRGSMPPTTATEVSHLGWHDGVDRALFRELTGFQTIERVFGRCSALTQHGGTWAPQIAYAAGRMGKPYFYSPFSLPGRGLAWYCGNLLIEGLCPDGSPYFDHKYRDTPAFEAELARLEPWLAQRGRIVDYSALFGCHPLITVMDQFPCELNFLHGVAPPPSRWRAPTMLPGVSIDGVLANFERLAIAIAAARDRGLEWTTVAGLRERYGERPIAVDDDVVLEAARAIVARGGPRWTDALSAGEAAYLLARRRAAPAARHAVPQAMGPLTEADAGVSSGDLDAVARAILATVDASSYLPAAPAGVPLDRAVVRLACAAIGATEPAAVAPLADEPTVAAALRRVTTYRDWAVHGPDFRVERIVAETARQCWTLKPALPRDDYARAYGARVSLGRDLQPMLAWG